jgi:AraC-like DNA-binding protein
MTNLNFAGVVLALLFFTLILTKRDKQLRDYLLAFFIFLLGAFLLIKYAFQNDLFNSYPIIIYLDIYYWVLLGPTLYIYTQVSTRGENYLRTNYLYTLIPAVLVTICFSKYVFVNPTALFSESEKFSLIAKIGIYIWLYNSPIFYVLTIIALRKHQKQIKNQFSFTRSIDLKWLYYLSHGFAVFILFLLSRAPIQMIFNWDYPFDNYAISLVVVLIYIFGIGFFGYRQRGIFDNYNVFENELVKPELPQRIETDEEIHHISYKKSGLNKEEALLIVNKLKSSMQSEQLYLESELDMSSLADKVEVSTHKLSQVINEYLNKNFFDFVNEYRIEKVKYLLSDPDNNHFKIISLAYDSGFNSKSTFYTLFKKLEGITPAQYRQKNQLKAG